MYQPLPRLLDSLWATATFEAAAEALLDALRGTLEAAIADGAFGRRATIRRCSLHLSDGDGFYAGLVRDSGEGAPDLAASRTVWEALCAARAGLVLDVGAREIQLWNGRSTTLPAEAQRSGTLTRLRSMAVTHALALPVRAPGGSLAGMVVLELGAPRAAGQAPGLTDEIQAELQSMVDLGALVARALPRRPAPPGAVPVNGSAAMRAFLEEAARLARGADPLLLRGARGVGKTWLAGWLAQHGHTPSPLERLHGAGLGASTLEAALRAADGTVFVDDLDQLPPPAQGALLRWLESGAEGPRLLLACGTSLERLVQRGQIGRALADRVGAWAVTLPDLAARRDEIPALAPVLLAAQLNLELELAPPLDPEAVTLLLAAPWPENLRGLADALRLGWREAIQRHRRAGRPSDPLSLRAEDLRRALMALQRPEVGVLEALRPGASALVDLARSRQEAQREPLKLGLAEGFSGLVLAEALERGLDVAEAADLLGLGHQRAAGNHWKTLRGAAEGLVRLCEEVGEPPPASLAALGPRWRQRRS